MAVGTNIIAKIYYVMSELPSETNWTALQWDGKNELWDEVLRTLSAFYDAEIDSATDPNAGELRSYYCGKAAALSEVRQHLLAARDMASSRKVGD